MNSLTPSARTLPLRLRGSLPRQHDHRLFEIDTAYLPQDRDCYSPPKNVL
jgi:hypothetical protein